MWLCPKGLNATPAADPERQTIYVISSDGRLYALDLATGKEKFRAVQFVPPFSKNWSLNLRGSTVYTSISQNCGDTPSGVASLDLGDPARPVVRHWRAARYGAGVWGRGGIVLGSQGRIFGATGDGDFDPAASDYGQTVFALDPETLQLLDYFTPRNWEYLKKRDFDMTASPVVFAYNDRQLLAVGGKEGLVYLMDTDRLGGDDHQSCLYTTRYSPTMRNGSRGRAFGAACRLIAIRRAGIGCTFRFGVRCRRRDRSTRTPTGPTPMAASPRSQSRTTRRRGSPF